MEIFWKTSAGILISLILILSIRPQAQHISILLAIAACCLTGIAASQVLKTVFDFLLELQDMIQMDNDTWNILLRLAGIGLTAEIIASVCVDAGCSSLGKSIQMLSTIVILYQSIPIFQNILKMIREIMGGL